MFKVPNKGPKGVFGGIPERCSGFIGNFEGITEVFSEVSEVLICVSGSLRRFPAYAGTFLEISLDF